MIKGIYAIADSSEKAKKYLESDIKLIQLRQKNPQERLQQAKQIQLLKSSFNFIFIINDDPVLTKEIGADGVHLGQEDMPVVEARKILGKEKIIGLSTHAINQVLDAQKQDINYIGFGAIFKSPTKSSPDHPVVGLDLLKQVVQISQIPVVAIGGINQFNIGQVWDTGVAAVAMISDLLITTLRY